MCVGVEMIRGAVELPDKVALLLGVCGHGNEAGWPVGGLGWLGDECWAVGE